MTKKLLGCLLILLALCANALAQEDPVLFTFEGEDVRESEVVRRAEAYAQSGIVPSATAYEETIDYMIVNQLAPQAKAKELGLDQYTQQELEESNEEAARLYEEQLDAYVAYFGAGLEGEEREAFREQIRSDWEAIGTTVESAQEAHLFSKTRERLLDSMGVTVTAEEILATFDEQVKKDEERFKDDVKAFEFYRYYRHADIWYTPAGFREVQEILLTGDDMAKARDALAAGEDFAEVARRFTGREPGEMWVHENSTLYSDEVVEAAFAEGMDSPGALSSVVSDAQGSHILRTVRDLPEGPVELDERIRQSIAAHVKQAKQDEILRQWAGEYEVKYNTGALEALKARAEAGEKG